MRTLFRLSLFTILALAVTGGCNSGGSRLEQFEKRCRSVGGDVCDQRYALCIAASCDPATMTDTTIECGHCGETDGSCGYCYVFEGKSCSYNAPCSEIEPAADIVYSTYSEELSYEFGFDVLQCESGPGFQADCMDAECRLTGETVGLTDKDGFPREVPTAICTCRLETEGAMATLGGLCSPQNCSSIWSTAGDRAGDVLSFVPQCSSPD
jgi:hypothetical protein